jgi:hypothetical protein
MTAAFGVPEANAAPTQPAFFNMIGLMLSSPNQTATNPWATKGTPQASPAQIADAMIRSMLGSPASSMTAAPAIPPVPEDSTPVPATVLNQAVPLPTTPNTNPRPAQAPRKQAPGAPGAPMPALVANTPVQAIVVSAPASQITAAAGGSKENMAPATTPPVVPSGSAAPAAKSSPEMRTAFTAILTPMKDTPAVSGSQIPPSPEPATSASNPPAVATGIASVAAQPVAAQNSLPQVAGPATATQETTDPQAGGDTPSQQGNDSPETPARPVTPAADARNKPAVQQDDNVPEAAAASAVHDRSIESFVPAPPADATRANAATPSNETAPAATPYSATAEALRTTESDLAAAPQPRTGAAQEISIRIAPPDSPAVDLRVVERAGQVHVDVRTSDSAMQTSLRQDLGTLTNSLERAGYHTETFTPSSILTRAAASAQTDHQQDPSQNRGGTGDFSGGRRQQQQQQKRPGTWLEEFEEQQ